MASNLKPCPFCGREPRRMDRASSVAESPTGWCWFIYCHCGGYAANAHIYGKTEEEAIAAWNTRSADAELDRLRAALEQIAATAGEDLEWPEVSRRTMLEVAAIAREALNAKG